MSDERVRGVQPSAAPPVIPVYDVVGISPRAELRVWVVGAQVLGLMHHWVADEEYPKGRSRLCSEPEEPCPWHDRGRLVWLGYLACLLMPMQRRVVLRMGEETARALLAHVGRVGSLRGAHLLLTARHDGPTSRAIIESLHEKDLTKIPGEHSVERTICTVLGCTGLPGMPRDVPCPHGEVPL